MPKEGMPAPAPGSDSDICMNQCRAMCCRGPWVLTLSKEEVGVFRVHAGDFGVKLVVGESCDGGGRVRFSDHPGDRCPMLDPRSFACRIYEERPQRCRDFPERPTPGCAISGA